jgi:hypothetical protein
MKYRAMQELDTWREKTDVFKGYNHNLRIGDGEFYDMKNLSSDNYPILSPRHQRGVYASPTTPLGMISKDAFCYVDGSNFITNEYREDLGLNDEPKTLVSMGAYVIIMPDKVWVNTQPKEGEVDHGNIEATYTVSSGTVQFSLCDAEGVIYGEASDIPSGTMAPENPANMELWVDISGTEPILKRYSDTTDQWVSISTTYIMISIDDGTTVDLTTLFSDGDGITISGVENSSLSRFNNTMVAHRVGEKSVIVTGMIGSVVTQDASNHPLTIARKMPNMDFVIESGNRLWGCRYGTALNGEVVNEIYASKLGDFKNWNCFAGISTDSYVASVGTDGQFTGAITYLGYPIFFKENCMHKVYGNYPSNYQVQTTACRGVQKGCSKSLAIVNETLYYKARTSVCAYDGSLPVEVSFALGDESYSEAVAGSLSNKYYISMKDANGRYHLFVYDTSKGMWHREDDTQAVEFCNARGDLYYIDYDTNQIKTVRGSGTLDTSPVHWEAVTGILGTDSPDKKYISRIDVRIRLDLGTRVTIYAEYDSSGEWVHLLTMDGVSLRSFAVPVRPKRCDHLRLKMVGDGDVKIYSIYKTVEQGSDV